MIVFLKGKKLIFNEWVWISLNLWRKNELTLPLKSTQMNARAEANSTTNIERDKIGKATSFHRQTKERRIFASITVSLSVVYYS